MKEITIELLNNVCGGAEMTQGTPGPSPAPAPRGGGGGGQNTDRNGQSVPSGLGGGLSGWASRMFGGGGGQQ